MELTFHYLCFYCNDYKKICLSVLVPATNYEIMQVLHYGNDVEKLIPKLLPSYLAIILIYGVISFAIIVPGQLIVKNKVMRKGNEKLLNNLKESVIIAHRDTGRLLFAN